MATQATRSASEIYKSRGVLRIQLIDDEPDIVDRRLRPRRRAAFPEAIAKHIGPDRPKGGAFGSRAVRLVGLVHSLLPDPLDWSKPSSLMPDCQPERFCAASNRGTEAADRRRGRGWRAAMSTACSRSISLNTWST